MSCGDLSFESPPCLLITWTIPDFFRQAAEPRYSLRSPDFTFADGRHSLRLFHTEIEGSDRIGMELLNSTDADPVLLYEVQVKSKSIREMKGYRRADYEGAFFFYRTSLEDGRRLYVPGGTLTVLCSVLRLTKPSRAGCPESGGAKARVIPESRRIGGELSFQLFPFLYVTWRIPRFSQLSRESRWTLESPIFPFCDSRCRLRLLSSENGIDMQLVSLTDTVPKRFVPYRAGLKSTTGEDIYMNGCGTSTTGAFFYILQDELDNKKSEIFPDDHLTVFCSMRSTEPNSGGAVSQVFPGSEAAFQISNEEDKEPLPGGVEKVLSDYKRLLLKGAESDACLVVCGKEFQAHRNILRARSPVFEAMFDHETAEKASGRVVIDDLKPDRFEDFLEYVYTGRVESFCDDNAFDLYAAADKYDLPTLKSECVEYMRRGLSVDNFCDVVILALRHHESDLLNLAVEFFKLNVAGIILTVKWQQFMSENSTRANELLIKLHVPGRESDDVLLP